jgi:hypothetical protein
MVINQSLETTIPLVLCFGLWVESILV